MSFITVSGARSLQPVFTCQPLAQAMKGPRCLHQAPNTEHWAPRATQRGPLPEARPEPQYFQHPDLGSSAPRPAAGEETRRAGTVQADEFFPLALSHTDIYIYINQITLILLFSSPRPLLTFPGSWFYQCYFKIRVTKDKLSASKPRFAQRNSLVHFLCGSNIVAAIF